MADGGSGGRGWVADGQAPAPVTLRHEQQVDLTPDLLPTSADRGLRWRPSAQDAIARCQGNEWAFPEARIAEASTLLNVVAVIVPEHTEEDWQLTVDYDEFWPLELSKLLDLLPAALHPWIATQLERLATRALRDAAELLWDDADHADELAAELAEDVKTFHREWLALETRHPKLRSDRFDQAGAIDGDGRRRQLESCSEQQLGRPLTASERLDCAALALTKGLYRNSPLEDAHAGPDSRVSDQDMLRGNVATYRAIRAFLDRPHPWPGIAAVLRDTDRRMPDGRAFADWLGDEQDEFVANIAGWLEVTQAQAALAGDDAIIDRLATSGLLGCADWFGHPCWPERIQRFAAVLGAGEWRDRPLPPRPDRITDEELLATLRDDPSQLTAEQADWCIAAALGFV